MNKEEFITLMQKTANDLGSNRLTREDLFKQSGVSRNEYTKHFDSWKDACKAAGLQTYSPVFRFAPKPHSRDDCLKELRRVADMLGRTDLSSGTFTKHAQFGCNVVIDEFGSWKKALDAAGLKLTTKSQQDSTPPPTREECISEMKRVAAFLGQNYLTRTMYDRHANINSHRVFRVFGSWLKALNEAELSPSPNYIREIPFENLTKNFLEIVKKLGKIPTLQQLVRRTEPVSHTYAGRFGGYSNFKQKAIDYIFSSYPLQPSGIRTILEIELERIRSRETVEIAGITVSPHHQGRTLNFRAFAYAPTSESDVVQMFGAIADDLGFEIVGNRSPFPDCEARRRGVGSRENFKTCLIEYEFSSRDYKKHRHPLKGCDLIVCWVHDWTECPIEVLDLSKEINKLNGWR